MRRAVWHVSSGTPGGIMRRSDDGHRATGGGIAMRIENRGHPRKGKKDEIETAWYCVDCDRTFPLSEDGDRCPTCGSRRVIDWAEDRHPVNRLDLLQEEVRP